MCVLCQDRQHAPDGWNQLVCNVASGSGTETRRFFGTSGQLRIAAFERRSQMCRDHTLRGSHPRQSIKHLIRHGNEQVLAEAVPQHLSNVLDDVPWEVWRALVRPAARPLALISRHGLLSVAVRRPSCQLMRPNSRRKVRVSGRACGKYGPRRGLLARRLASTQGTFRATSKPSCSTLWADPGGCREQHPPLAYCVPARNPGAKTRSTSSIRRAVSSSGRRCLWRL